MTRGNKLESLETYSSLVRREKGEEQVEAEKILAQIGFPALAVSSGGSVGVSVPLGVASPRGRRRQRIDLKTRCALGEEDSIHASSPPPFDPLVDFSRRVVHSSNNRKNTSLRGEFL